MKDPRVTTTNLFEPAEFDNLPAPGPISGWCVWKDGKPKDHSVHPTKQDLLMGYDIMWIIGLDNCERVLNDSGITCQPSSISVSATKAHCWAATVKGLLLPGMLEWSVCCEYDADPDRPLWKPSPERVLKSAAGYLGGLARDSRANNVFTDMMRPGVRLKLAQSDEDALSRFWWALEDEYTKREFAQIRSSAQEVMDNLEVEVVHLSYLPATLDEVAPGSEVIEKQFLASEHQHQRYCDGMRQQQARRAMKAQVTT